jgi:hypothetical protein
MVGRNARCFSMFSRCFMFEDGTGRQAEFLQMLAMMEVEGLTAKETKCYVFIKCE